METNKIAVIGVLTSMAIILSYFERMLPVLIPGVKLGLANIVVVLCLYHLGTKAAFKISLIRVFVIGILFGGMSSILYALSGALLSFLGMIILKQTKLFSIVGVSVIGSSLHVVGQIFVAILVLQHKGLLMYLPILLLSALVSGIFIGVLSHRCLYNIGFSHR